MSETLSVKFEQKPYPQERELTPEAAAATILALSDVVMKLSRIKRAPRYEDGRRETDAEHTVHVALVAVELAARFRPDLDPGLVALNALYHELPELKTGDKRTFNISEADLAKKRLDDKAASEALYKELPPEAARRLREYEEQATPESQYVCAIDKVVPLATDCVGDGVRVMQEDYSVTTTPELVVAHNKLKDRMQRRFPQFPEVIETHSVLAELFELEFDAATADALSQSS